MATTNWLYSPTHDLLQGTEFIFLQFHEAKEKGVSRFQALKSVMEMMIGANRGEISKALSAKYWDFKH